MTDQRKPIAAIYGLAALFAAMPARASDFTGILTFMVSLFGGTFLWVAVSMFGVSRLTRRPGLRQAVWLAGLPIGAGLTVWWIADPIAEGSALSILLALPIAAAIGVALADRPHDGQIGD